MYVENFRRGLEEVRQKFQEFEEGLADPAASSTDLYRLFGDLQSAARSLYSGTWPMALTVSEVMEARSEQTQG